MKMIDPVSFVARSIIPKKENESVFHFSLFSIYCLIILNLSRNYLPQQWPTFGFEINNESVVLALVLLVLALAPVLFLPKKHDKVSDFFNLIFYITVYVPTIFVVGALDGGDGMTVLPIAAAYLAAMAIMSMLPSLRPFEPRGVLTKPGQVESVVLLAAAVVVAYLAVRYRAVFDIVGLDDMYEQRKRAAEQFTRLDTYLYIWSENVLLPILVLFACHWRRLRYAVAAILLCTVLFAILSTKSAVINLVAPAVLYVLFSAFRRDTLVIIIAGAALLSLIAVLSTINVFDWRGQIAVFWAFRSLGLPGMFSFQYQEFFSENGHTYLSHVFPIKYFIQYPYELPMFNEIARHYYGSVSQANAHFLATDGSGGFGLLGVPAMALVCGCVFIIADAMTRHLPPHLVPVLCFGFTTFLTNVSLFTSILTGGLFFMLLIAYFWRPAVDAPAPRWSF
jgi:hypothetical protein